MSTTRWKFVRLSQKVHAALKRVAKAQGRSMHATIAAFVAAAEKSNG